MKLLRKRDYEEGRFTLAFVGYGDEETNTVLELTHNWDTSSYDLGNAMVTLLLVLTMPTKRVKKLKHVVAKLFAKRVQ